MGEEQQLIYYIFISDINFYIPEAYCTWTTISMNPIVSSCRNRQALILQQRLSGETNTAHMDSSLKEMPHLTCSS